MERLTDTSLRQECRRAFGGSMRRADFHVRQAASMAYLGAALIAGLCSFGAAGDALAANCSSRGGLAYLGNTKGATRSVWLSGTSAGSFGLEAAQGNQTVDTWSKSKRGLHLSLSPVVSNGNGGTHKLYDTSSGKPCLLDTQNQVRNIIFPNIDWPDGRPDVGPQPVFPGFNLPDGRPDVGPQPVFPGFNLPDGRPDVGPQPVFPGFNLPDGRPDVGPQPVFPGFHLPDGRPDVGPQPVFPGFNLPDGRPDVGPQPVFPGFTPRTPTAIRGGRVVAAPTPAHLYRPAVDKFQQATARPADLPGPRCRRSRRPKRRPITGAVDAGPRSASALALELLVGYPVRRHIRRTL
ncbi:hypothetical protein [Ensifer canadensis]